MDAKLDEILKKLDTTLVKLDAIHVSLEDIEEEERSIKDEDFMALKNLQSIPVNKEHSRISFLSSLPAPTAQPKVVQSSTTPLPVVKSLVQ